MKRFLSLFIASLLLVIMTQPVLPKASALGPNLISNSSVETVNPSNTALPTDWLKEKRGSNTTSFTYPTSGLTGSRSVQVKMTTYRNGDAKWYFKPVAVTPNTTYTFSDYYMSSVATELVVKIQSTTGAVSYQTLKTVPSSVTWQQVSASYTSGANAKEVTVFHLIKKVGSLQIDDAYLGLTNAGTPSAPAVSVTAPTAGTVLSNTVTVSATASDTVAVAGVQFKLDGVNLGIEDIAAPYTTSWDTTAGSNGSHTLTAIARNSQELTTTSNPVSVSVNNVIISPPVDQENLVLNPSVETSANDITPDNWMSNSWGTNTVSYTYDTTGHTGTKSVHTTISSYTSGDAKWYFEPVTVTALKSYIYRDYYKSTAPTRIVAAFIDASGTYSYKELGTVAASSNWSLYEATVAMPATAIKATVFHVIESTGSLSIDDALFQVAVVTPADISVPNGSLENGGTTPTGWSGNSWGANSPVFSYVTNEGHTGTRSAKISVSNYVSGDAKWFFEPIKSLTPGTQYRFTTWYKGTAQPHVVALYIDSNNVEHYIGMPNPLTISSTTWQKYSDTFTVPLGTTSVSLFMFVQGNGWLQTDDYSITTYHPAGFNRPLLTLTFDDGHEDNAANALPLLNKYGFKSTQCYATTFIEGQSQSVKDGVMAFVNSGHEICSHTVTHPFLTTLTTANLDYELAHSKAYLEALIGKAVPNFATPYGDYNATVNNTIDNYYQSHRTVDEGFNGKDNFDQYRLRVQNILDTTSSAQVRAWIEQAQADNTWLILVYHRVAANPGPYDSYINVFQQHLQAIAASGITVRTWQDAITEVRAQL